MVATIPFVLPLVALPFARSNCAYTTRVTVTAACHYVEIPEPHSEPPADTQRATAVLGSLSTSVRR